MNLVKEAIMRATENLSAPNALAHYGRSKMDGAPGPGSGRYPLGSGENPNQHQLDFLSRVRELRSQGVKEAEIAKAVGCKNTSELRVKYAMARNDQRTREYDQIKALLADGKTLSEVTRIMGKKNDSSIRSILNEDAKARSLAAQRTADFLKAQVDAKGMIDIGAGVEQELGVSREKLKQAVAILEAEGYVAYGGRVPQATNPGKKTTIDVLCPPGTEHKEIYDYENVHQITDYRCRDDAQGNDTFQKGFVYPASMDSKRLAIRYNEEGGIEKDGLVEIRPGVKDLSLGESRYAQVRILVDHDKYIKGMAVYSEDLPDGVDVLFNTNKSVGTPMEKVLKPIKDDPDNPFGSAIKETGGQYTYLGDDGKEHLGLINKRAAEGDWSDWNNALPAQFLAKQSQQLINKQLNLAKADKDAELEEIMRVTNPTVRKEMLQDFADGCDAAAVRLQAAALPRQRHQVILPVPTMKDNEVYAPNYEDGETVALIRYPHGGTFEIPIVKVNNKQPDARRMLGDTANTALDVVCMNSKVAERLSGADFDGDAVMVIPCNSDRSSVRITSTHPLEGLKGFDPKVEYAYRPGIQLMKRKSADGKKEIDNTQIEMGKISNLITDMTLQGAPEPELARAVRHSMVVIDAAKHQLDYKRSERENGIDALKKRYQGHVDEDGKYHSGASTLISKAKSPYTVLKRRGNPWINPDTGELQWTRINPETGEIESKEVRETYVDKHGRTKVRTQDSTRMAETRDARILSSGTKQEEAYADYANYMKALANKARKTMVHTQEIPYDPNARVVYQGEVRSLNEKLRIARANAPRERAAQLLTSSVVKAKKTANPDMTGKDVKKAGQLALTAYRKQLGAHRQPIFITDREWEAIQAGAITKTALRSIIHYADKTTLKQHATPRAITTVTSGKAARIKAMQASGYTTSQIAAAVDLSPSTVSRFLRGKE